MGRIGWRGWLMAWWLCALLCGGGARAEPLVLDTLGATQPRGAQVQVGHRARAVARRFAACRRRHQVVAAFVAVGQREIRERRGLAEVEGPGRLA